MTFLVFELRQHKQQPACFEVPEQSVPGTRVLTVTRTPALAAAPLACCVSTRQAALVAARTRKRPWCTLAPSL
eukprot:1202159-Rhodomonas_salina.1